MADPDSTTLASNRDRTTPQTCQSYTGTDIGIGIDNFSITPAAVGPVKAMVRSIEAAAVRTKVEALLAKPPANGHG